MRSRLSKYNRAWRGVRSVALALVTALLVPVSTAAAQTQIKLRPSANVTITESSAARSAALAEIAEISGSDAERLGTVSIRPSFPGNSQEITITIEDVRLALNEVSPRINWGRVTLSGSACVVRFRRDIASISATETRPPTHVRHDAAPQPIDHALLLGTVRSVVVARLLDLYTVAPQDLRLGFDAGDADLLDASAADPAGRRVDVQPGGGANSGRVPVSVLIYDGDRVVRSESIVVQAQVQRDAVVARSTIARNQVVTAESVQTARQWMSPSAKSPLPMDQVVGGVSMTRIAAGAIIATGDVASAIACKRGELVTVHVLSGPVTVRAKARALSQARDGELVQLKIDGTKEPFLARMSGRGRAVMVVPGAGNEQLQEFPMAGSNEVSHAEP